MKNSIPNPSRSFKAWLYELLKVWNCSIKQEIAKMYYNGGYSPRMVFNEINMIPIGWDQIYIK